MSTPQGPDQGRTDVLARLDAELAEISRRVAGVRDDLGALRTPAPGAPAVSAASPGPTMTGAGPATPPWSPAAGQPPGPQSWTPPPPLTPRAPSPAASAPGSPASTPAASGPSGFAPSPFATSSPGPGPVWGPPAGTGPRVAPSLAWPPAASTAGADEPPASRWWRGPGAPARWLAVAGAGVTLIGVVLLLVLAAQRGWFGPPARIAGGAVLGAALLAAGVRVRRGAVARAGGTGSTVDRTDPADTGALALVATGVAALFLDVAAATALYHYLPVAVGLVLALAVTGGGLALADRWRRAGLALGTLLGGQLLLVVLLDVVPSTVALLLVAQLAALPVALRRGWPALSTTAAVVTGIGAFFAVVRELLVTAVRSDVSLVPIVAVVLATLVLALVTATADATRSRATAGTGATGSGATRTGSGGAATAAALRAGLVLASPAPALLLAIGGHLLPTVAAVVLALAVGAALAAVAVVVGRDLLPARWRPVGPARTVVVSVAVALAALTLLQATVLAVDGPATVAVLLAEAVVFVVVALRLPAGRAARPVVVLALGYGVVAALVAVADGAALDALVEAPGIRSPGRGTLVAWAVASLLLAVVAVGLLAVLARHRLLRGRPVTVTAAALLGLVALRGLTGAFVHTALAVSQTDTGFLTGHVLTTVSWTALALVLLVRGVRDSVPRVLGGVLVVGAVAKLIAFDLGALDGIARVVVFLVAGIVLLSAGSRYARLVADQGADPAADRGADPDVTGRPDTAPGAASPTSAARSSREGPAGIEGRQPEA